MLKLLFVFTAIAMMFTSQVCSMPEKLSEEVMFSGYNNGHEIVMTEDDLGKFDEIFCELLKDCRPMPAFGVSIHEKTIEAIQEGVWVRFVFDETLTVNELPFDELLINLTKDMYGFNVIRGNNGVYDGRCFYVDVPRNMDKLYEFMISLPVGEKKFEIREALQTVLVNEEVCEDYETCEGCKTCEDCEKGEVEESSLINQDLKIKEVGAMEDLIQAESMPSVNKDNKDKSNTVIDQSQINIENTLLNSIEF